MPINRRDREPFIVSALNNEYTYYICHWEAIRLMPELRDIKWFHIIADEVHKLQSRQSQTSKALKVIPAYFKTGLSGTPAYDKPDDLWSVLNWLYPKRWRAFHKYFDRYVLWVNYKGYKEIIGVANEEELQEQLEPFYVCHKKSDVAKDLPPVYFTEHFVDLEPKQRRAYNNMRDDMLAWIGKREDEAINAPVVIAQLIRLMQLACAYGELDENDKVKLTEPSSKIDAIMDIIEDTKEPIVIFSQYSKVIDLLCERLKKNKVTYGKYTGDTNQTQRQDAINGFKDGQYRIFAATLGAGGTGIDGLQNICSTAIFIDRSWSHAVNNQAIGRLYRIGQKNPVQIIDVIANNTIDSKRLTDINFKWDIVKQLLGDDKK